MSVITETGSPMSENMSDSKLLSYEAFVEKLKKVGTYDSDGQKCMVVSINRSGLEIKKVDTEEDAVRYLNVRRLYRTYLVFRGTPDLKASKHTLSNHMGINLLTHLGLYNT